MGDPGRRSARRDGGSDGGDGGGGESRTLSRVEGAVIAVSVTLTVALFGFAVWQAVAPPGAQSPVVEVIGHRATASGDVVYAVAVRNPTDVGLVSVTVEANCTTPPTELTLQHVPTDSRRVGRIVCPPGTTDPGVSVSSWARR